MRIFLAFSQQSAPLCELLHMRRSMPLTRTCTGCDGAFLVIDQSIYEERKLMTDGHSRSRVHRCGGSSRQYVPFCIAGISADSHCRLCRGHGTASQSQGSAVFSQTSGHERHREDRSDDRILRHPDAVLRRLHAWQHLQFLPVFQILTIRGKDFGRDKQNTGRYSDKSVF